MEVTHTKTNVIQYNEYYAFGLQTNASWTRVDEQPNQYLYNSGSELNVTTGWYETMFRDYDAAIGRFMQVDAMAAAYAQWSPYAYAMNNPVLMNDPTGLYPAWYPEGYGEPGDLEDKLFKDNSEGWSRRSGNSSRYISARPASTSWGYYVLENHGFATYVSTDGGKTFKFSSYTDDFQYVWKSRIDLVSDIDAWDWGLGNTQQGWFSDQQGKILGMHWLEGSGTDMIMVEGGWGDYMRQNASINKKLMQMIDYDVPTRTKSGSVYLRATGNTGVNDRRSGYGMLHGTSNLFINWDIKVIDEKNLYYSATLTWQDRIDPSARQGDTPWVHAAEAFGYAPRDYNVSITWTIGFNVQRK